MKNPNGYGSVYKLSGKRRKPWIARKTVGWDDLGKQQCQTLGYYKTRPEAMLALAEFNNDPYDLVRAKMKFEELYAKWSTEKYRDLKGDSSIKNYRTAYSRLSEIHKTSIVDIKKHQLQNIIDVGEYTREAKARIRNTLSQVFDWAIEKDFMKFNPAEKLTLPKRELSKNQRTAFSRDEIAKLWANMDKNEYMPFLLILIYSGCRISELLDLEKADVNLENQHFLIRDAKTASGIRVVPIANKVLPFWKTFINRSKSKYAFENITGGKLTYENFRKRYWDEIMSIFDMTHTIHETRHTCISLLAMAHVDPTIIKKIVGHKSAMSLTEAVYTHLDVTSLLEAINKI